MTDRFPENDALAKLVAQARSVPTPKVNVTAQEIRAAVKAEERKGYLRWGGGLAAAAAIVFAVSLFGGNASETEATTTTTPTSVAVTTPDEQPAETHVDEPGVTPTIPAVEAEPPRPEPTPTDPPPPTELALAEGITVTTESGTDPVVVSQWQIEVSAGVYRIAVETTVESTFHVKHRKRTLDVEPGTELVFDNGKFDIQRGRAHWQDEDKAERPSASMLAARAESEMASGDRAAAIQTLTKLARLHPRASETRTGLVDLARLRTAAGDRDHARCAYELALERWPNASIATDIRRALDRLGEGRACKGLRPN